MLNTQKYNFGEKKLVVLGKMNHSSSYDYEYVHSNGRLYKLNFKHIVPKYPKVFAYCLFHF
jgi:hypothetical protein